MPTFDVVTAVDEDLVLPMKGGDGVVRNYAIRPATAGEFIQLSAMQKLLLAVRGQRGLRTAGPDVQELPETQRDLHRLVLGADVVDAMIADKVSGSDLQRATATAFQWHCSGGDADVAARVWAGKARPPAQTLSVRAGGAAPSTRKPASGSGTTSRRKRKANAKG